MGVLPTKDDDDQRIIDHTVFHGFENLIVCKICCEMFRNEASVSFFLKFYTRQIIFRQIKQMYIFKINILKYNLLIKKNLLFVKVVMYKWNNRI